MTTTDYVFIVIYALQIHPYHYTIFNVFHLVFYYPSYLLIHIHLNPPLLLLLILPTQNNESVKAPFTHDVWNNTVFRSCKYVTEFGKTDHIVTIHILRNTNLKY